MSAEPLPNDDNEQQLQEEENDLPVTNKKRSSVLPACPQPLGSIFKHALLILWRIFMNDSVQFVAGVTTGVFFLMLIYHVLALAIGFFMLSQA